MGRKIKIQIGSARVNDEQNIYLPTRPPPPPPIHTLFILIIPYTHSQVCRWNWNSEVLSPASHPLCRFHFFSKMLRILNYCLAWRKKSDLNRGTYSLAASQFAPKPPREDFQPSRIKGKRIRTNPKTRKNFPVSTVSG